MKRQFTHLSRSLKHLSIVLVVFSVGYSVLAQSSTPAPPKHAGRPAPRDIWKWDLNQNGRLDPDEMEAARKERIRQRQARLETHGKAAVEARKAQDAARHSQLVPPGLTQKYDSNTNGLIDSTEWAAYRRDVNKSSAEKPRARTGTNNVPSSGVVATNQPSISHLTK